MIPDITNNKFVSETERHLRAVLELKRVEMIAMRYVDELLQEFENGTR